MSFLFLFGVFFFAVGSFHDFAPTVIILYVARMARDETKKKKKKKTFGTSAPKHLELP